MTISRYSVVQYVPRPLSDEKINIGVIAWDDNGVDAEFLVNWKRVSNFGQEDISYVKEFANNISEIIESRTQLDAFRGNNPFGVKEITKIIDEWKNCIQFSPPRGSTRSRRELLTDVVPIFLSLGKKSQKKSRSRTMAAKLASKAIEEQLDLLDQTTKAKLLRRDFKFKGECTSHEFPIGLVNGSPLLAVEALSFEIADRRKLELELDSVCWSCADIRKKDRHIKLALFALQSQRNSETYRKANVVLGKLKVDVITEDSLTVWATALAKSVEAYNKEPNSKVLPSFRKLDAVKHTAQ
jgi:hypothetical protein